MMGHRAGGGVTWSGEGSGPAVRVNRIGFPRVQSDVMACSQLLHIGKSDPPPSLKMRPLAGDYLV